AKAHRGILYVDEANLLDDHLVDLLLGASAGGINIVEREGISSWHLSEFMLIGTMNPEEGELRPQLLDRFGLCIQIDSLDKTGRRVEIMKRHHEFIDDPASFCRRWLDAETEEQRRVQQAISMMGDVRITLEKYSIITRMCNEAQVAGHRADIVIEKAARALAAYYGRNELEYRDLELAASLALPHRVRRKDEEPHKGARLRANRDEPAEQIQVGAATADDCDSGRKKSKKEKKKSGESNESVQANAGESRREHEDDSRESVGGFFVPHLAGSGDAPNAATPIPFDISRIINGRIKTTFTAPGRRYCSESTAKQGRYVRAAVSSAGGDIAFDATIRAAAPFQSIRPRAEAVINIQPDDIRIKIREQKKNTLLVFVVDASGSIGNKLMRETKGAILYFLQDAYIKRDKVCLIAFRNDRAETLLPPTSSIDLAMKKLQDLPTGGKTPLCAGMLEGYNVIRSSLITNKGILPLLVLITDGRANVGMDASLASQGTNTFLLYDELFAMAETIRSERRLNSVIIDVEPAVIGAFRMSEQIAEKMGAKYVALDAIKSGTIAHAVRTAIASQEYEWRE
ncbi:MAG: VWA domain-containing protein, partial [Spirochaetes bacterium]|nr:VWA domain-containing protein [Spirochaetota bacterium]